MGMQPKKRKLEHNITKAKEVLRGIQERQKQQGIG